MSANCPSPLTVVQRRRAMRLAYWNGMAWAIGNGLASTTLVIFLAIDLGAKQIGLGIGLILAMRHIVGLLRLGAPALIGRLFDRKQFCIGSYLASAIVLLCLPLVAAPGMLSSANASLAALVVLWCVYHLLQYFGTIALWSWLGDLVPLRIRGRFIGRRNRWTVGGEAAAMLASGLFVWGWLYLHPGEPKWIAYIIPAVIGGFFMIGALVPLTRMSRTETGRVVRQGATARDVAAPFFDKRFLMLILFGCSFSLANGLTQSVQYSFPKNVLFAGSLAEAGLFLMLALMTLMKLGQLSISPWMGRLADRLGNRPVMIASLLLVAQGPLFYFIASPEQWWWIAGAWLVWIAYAGLNVCLPNLMLKLAPSKASTSYIAAYYAMTGLCYAATTILGGRLYDRFKDEKFCWLGRFELDYHQSMFLLGWIARCLAVVVLLFVVERTYRNRQGSRYS